MKWWINQILVFLLIILLLKIWSIFLIWFNLYIERLIGTPIPSQQILETEEFFLFFNKLRRFDFKHKLVNYKVIIISSLPINLTNKFIDSILYIVKNPIWFQFLTFLPNCESKLIAWTEYLLDDDHLVVAFFKIFSCFGDLDKSIWKQFILI
jgi:hypothetical protein